jgi:hypothetical protein
MQYDFTDEVARNGALSRITSARGFLERPLLFATRPSCSKSQRKNLLKIKNKSSKNSKD